MKTERPLLPHFFSSENTLLFLKIYASFFLIFFCIPNDLMLEKISIRPAVPHKDNN